MKLVAASGSAPDSARLQRAANLSQLHSHGELRDVESHHDQKAYEAPRVLNLPAIDGMKLARRPGAAPVTQGFGGPAAQAGARRVDM